MLYFRDTFRDAWSPPTISENAVCCACLEIDQRFGLHRSTLNISSVAQLLTDNFSFNPNARNLSRSGRRCLLGRQSYMLTRVLMSLTLWRSCRLGSGIRVRTVLRFCIELGDSSVGDIPDSLYVNYMPHRCVGPDCIFGPPGQGAQVSERGAVSPFKCVCTSPVFLLLICHGVFRDRRLIYAMHAHAITDIKKVKC